MTATAQRGALRHVRPQFPDGIDGDRLLEPTRHSVWLQPGRGPARPGEPKGASDYRRAITRTSPLLFAVTYFGRALRDQTTGLMSFNPFHMDAFACARHWIEPTPQRGAWVVQREGGKSTLFYRVLPLWALGFGHRKFFMAFAYTADQARGHLGYIADVLYRRDPVINRETGARVSDLLLTDFPELVPVRGAGGPGRHVLAGGSTIQAASMASTRRGMLSGEVRPDLLIGDDLQPGEADWTPKVKRKAISRIVQNVLPMNDRAAVVLTGTTVAHGCLMHDVVLAAKGEASSAWLTGERIMPHYYPAILDQGLPSQRSLWPQRWPLEHLLARASARGEAGRSFALNMMNDPPADGSGAYWTQESFRIHSNPVVSRWVAWVDPAKSTHATSDHTAIVVAGALPTRAMAWVAHAEAGFYPPAKTRERLAALREVFPGLLVCVEENAVGSRDSAHSLYGLERGDEVIWAHASKDLRIRSAADLYDEEIVRHTRPLHALQKVLVEYPDPSGRDDLADALAGALGRVLPGRIPQ